MFIACTPILRRLFVVHLHNRSAQGLHFFADALHARFNCSHCAAQSQKQIVLCGCCSEVIHPGTGIQWQGLAAPLVQTCERLCLRQTSTLQCGLAWRDRQYLQRQLGDQPQLTHAASQQTRDVIASHVFHHLPAKCELLAFAVDHLGTQDEITHIAYIGARWAA